MDAVLPPVPGRDLSRADDNDDDNDDDTRLRNDLLFSACVVVRDQTRRDKSSCCCPLGVLFRCKQVCVWREETRPGQLHTSNRIESNRVESDRRQSPVALAMSLLESPRQQYYQQQGLIHLDS